MFYKLVQEQETENEIIILDKLCRLENIVYLCHRDYMFYMDLALWVNLLCTDHQTAGLCVVQGSPNCRCGWQQKLDQYVAAEGVKLCNQTCNKKCIIFLFHLGTEQHIVYVFSKSYFHFKHNQAYQRSFVLCPISSQPKAG